MAGFGYYDMYICVSLLPKCSLLCVFLPPFTMIRLCLFVYFFKSIDHSFLSLGLHWTATNDDSSLPRPTRIIILPPLSPFHSRGYHTDVGGAAPAASADILVWVGSDDALDGDDGGGGNEEEEERRDLDKI